MAISISCAPQKIELKQEIFYPDKYHSPRIQFLAALGDAGNINADKHFINFLPQDRISHLQIHKPYGLGLMGDKLFLCDTKKNGIWVLDIKNRKKRYQLLTSGRKIKLVEIAMESGQGRAYIVDIGQKRLIIYNKQGKLVNSFAVNGKPVDVAVSEDRIYILNSDKHSVEVWNKDLTKPITRIGKKGHDRGEFFMPNSIAVDHDGFLYVADTGNARVQKFDRQGKFLMSIGEAGNSPGCFLRPKGIAIDRRGNIYVVDALLQNVQLFDPRGNLLLYFGQVPIEGLDLKLPVKIILDYDYGDNIKSMASPGFTPEYLIYVSNQIGLNKVNVYGFGH